MTSSMTSCQQMSSYSMIPAGVCILCMHACVCVFVFNHVDTYVLLLLVRTGTTVELFVFRNGQQKVICSHLYA